MIPALSVSDPQPPGIISLRVARGRQALPEARPADHLSTGQKRRYGGDVYVPAITPNRYGHPLWAYSADRLAGQTQSILTDYFERPACIMDQFRFTLNYRSSSGTGSGCHAAAPGWVDPEAYRRRRRGGDP